MKQFLAIIVGFFLAHSAAWAWPDRAVTIVTNMPAGASPDLVLRIVAEKLSQKWHVEVRIENKPGAAGLVALQHYVSTGDNHTIYYGDASNFTAVPLLYKKQDLIDQVTPLAPVYDNFSWVVIMPAGVRDEDFVASVKANPKFGSWGVGSAGHLCGEEILKNLGIKGSHVPYRNFGQWFTDVSNGVLSFSCTSFGSAQAMVDAGKIKWYAVTGPEKPLEFKDVPTIKQRLGLDHFRTERGWLAFYTHHRFTAKQLANIEKDLLEVLEDPAVIKTIHRHHARTWTDTNFRDIIKQDYRVTDQMLREFSISIDN